MPENMTTSYLAHDGTSNVLIGYLDGRPIYGPYGSNAVTLEVVMPAKADEKIP